MWRAPWNEDNIARAELQQLFPEAEIVVSFADDERLVICWVTVVACARLGWLDGLADGVGTPVFGSSCLEGHAHPTDLERLAFSRLKVPWLHWGQAIPCGATLRLGHCIGTFVAAKSSVFGKLGADTGRPVMAELRPSLRVADRPQRTRSQYRYLCSSVHVAHARMRGYRWADDPAAI